MGTSSTTPLAQSPGLKVDVEAWHVLPATAETMAPESPKQSAAPLDLGFIDALSRRRLSSLSKMALYAAWKVAHELNSASFIFASRHGELGRTMDILHAMGRGDMPSPTAFSLSVHNTVAGIYSIARGDQAASTALAAGDETLLWGVMEAAVRLADKPDAPIVLVYADEPLPDPLQAFRAQGERPMALAMRLRSGDNFRLSWEANPDQPASAIPLPQAMAALLAQPGSQMSWTGERLRINGAFHA